jgi:hypothetical protein
LSHPGEGVFFLQVVIDARVDFPLAQWAVEFPFKLGFFVGQRGGTLYFKIEHFILGSLHSFIFLNDRPIKLAHFLKKEKKIELWRHII